MRRLLTTARKEKKKAAEGKKRRSEEKKREKKREQRHDSGKEEEEVWPVEASAAMRRLPTILHCVTTHLNIQMSFSEELEHDAATYPFVQKEPEVISLEEDGRLQLDFLRIKSPLLKDTFHFPAIGDVDSVDRSRVLGVLTVSTGTTQRQGKPDQGPPPLRDFNPALNPQAQF
ncbi:hypothetical protein GWK47_049695 [Chionoecetes opilio]|uniref:Uncharacterized protein n=1 Tax=Chionoecetes opilio TaxID=41210 RepID=A0A8J4Y379_CHIOP|nr:hypothetical protein GWK47_049695 [Chionoecetes opilio]